jgi:hypothetical protein
MVVSMTAFRNEMIQRTALEFQKNGAPLFVQCLSKRTFRKEIIEERAAAYRMPGMLAAFERVAEHFEEDEQLAFMQTESGIKIFYADTDETIGQLMDACHKIANQLEKSDGIGQTYSDTFLMRVERALFELLFLTDKTLEEMAFVSGGDQQKLADVREGKTVVADLTLKQVNRLLGCFPEAMNLDWMFS